MIFDKIPLYYSMDIDKADIIQLEDSSIFIIANENFRKTLGDRQFEIYVLHNVLKIILETNDDFIRDLHIAKWFSCSDTIDYIKTFNKSSSNKDLRIKNIYKYVNKIERLSINSINELINTVKTVSIQ